ncbi:hypothetical protein JCM3774_003162 [Rhodotorula dairenensis]
MATVGPADLFTYRTPPSVQIELEEAAHALPPRAASHLSGFVPAHEHSYPAAAAPAGSGRFRDAFDLAQRIELTGVIDMAYEEEVLVAATTTATATSLGLGQEKKEKKTCTKACANCKKAARVAAAL